LRKEVAVQRAMGKKPTGPTEIILPSFDPVDDVAGLGDLQLRPPNANKASDAQVHEVFCSMSLVGGGCVAFACDTFQSFHS